MSGRNAFRFLRRAERWGRYRLFYGLRDSQIVYRLNPVAGQRAGRNRTAFGAMCVVLAACRSL